MAHYFFEGKRISEKAAYGEVKKKNGNDEILFASEKERKSESWRKKCTWFEPQ